MQVSIVDNGQGIEWWQGNKVLYVLVTFRQLDQGGRSAPRP